MSLPHAVAEEPEISEDPPSNNQLSRLPPEAKTESRELATKTAENGNEEGEKEEVIEDEEGEKEEVIEDEEEDDDDEPVIYTYTLKHDDGTSELIQEEWSEQHAKILHLMSLYAKCALTASDNESWIRNIPLVVLMYEGIVAGVIDFDYAPCSVLITQNGKSKRVWMNVTQGEYI
jgi:hypothetical protein